MVNPGTLQLVRFTMQMISLFGGGLKLLYNCYMRSQIQIFFGWIDLGCVHENKIEKTLINVNKTGGRIRKINI